MKTKQQVGFTRSLLFIQIDDFRRVDHRVREPTLDLGQKLKKGSHFRDALTHAGFVDDAGIFHIISRVAEHRNHRIKPIWVVVDGKLLVILIGDDGRLRRDNVVNLRKTIKRASVASGAMVWHTLLSVRLSKAWNGIPILCFVCWHWYMHRGLDASGN